MNGTLAADRPDPTPTEYTATRLVADVLRLLAEAGVTVPPIGPRAHAATDAAAALLATLLGEPDQDQIIDEAIGSIRSYAVSDPGMTITRDMAEGVIKLWGRYGELTPAQLDRVLAHFPVTREPRQPTDRPTPPRRVPRAPWAASGGQAL